MPGSERPPDVQVLGEEAGRDHPHPVVHPALVEQLAHRRVDHGVAGATLPPGLDRVGDRRAVVLVGHPGQRRAQVVPGRTRVVPQDIGVELAPGQLGREPLGTVAEVPAAVREVGQERAWVDRPDLEVGREPGHAVEVGAVAVGAVVGQGGVPEVRPPSQRRLLTRLGEGREVRASRASFSVLERRLVGAHLREAQALGLGGGRRPAVLAPGAGERGEDLVGRALAASHRTRAHGIRGARLDPGTPVSASAAATSRSRRRPAGVVSRETCTEPAPSSSASWGTTVTGSPSRTHRRPSYAASAALRLSASQARRASPAPPTGSGPARTHGDLALPRSAPSVEPSVDGGVVRGTQRGEVTAAQVPAQPEDARRRHAELLQVIGGWAVGGHANPLTCNVQSVSKMWRGLGGGCGRAQAARGQSVLSGPLRRASSAEASSGMVWLTRSASTRPR